MANNKRRKKIGLAISFVDEGIDTGDIILQKEFSIGHKDTIGKAVRQSLKIFPQMLVEALVKIESGKYKRIKQNKRKGKYWKKRQPKDGLIDWSKMTAIQIYNFVRALTKPYPEAFTYIKGRKVILWTVEVLRKKSNFRPGRIIHLNKNDIIISTKNNFLKTNNFQIENLSYLKSFEIIKNYIGDYFEDK